MLQLATDSFDSSYRFSIAPNTVQINQMDESAIAGSTLDCAVCLQSCIHPTKLPCGHIFCFLCVKGVANQSKRCAMCRREIPSDYFKNPKLLEVSYDSADSEDLEFQWYYEGKNGWWKYDVRTNKELDSAFRAGVRTCELLIAGFLYAIDFDSMMQLRRNDPTRKRKIKRDAVSVPSKGVAGIRNINDRTQNKKQDDDATSSHDQTVVTERTAAISLSDVLNLMDDDSSENNNGSAGNDGTNVDG